MVKMQTAYRCIFWALCLPLALFGQDTGQLVSRAEKAWAAGRYLEAAENFERAGHLQTDRPILLNKAAEAYYLARNYEKAADCYRPLRQYSDRYPLTGLRYARALKQSGRYPEAREAFRHYLSAYKGEYQSTVETVVALEIQGCEWALQQANDTLTNPSFLTAIPLPTPEKAKGNAFAPIAFSSEVLYFSFNVEGQNFASLWRINRPSADWAAPIPASGLPAEAGRNFSSGAFSPDGQRYYCVQCLDAQLPENAVSKSPADRLNCKILALRKTENGWTNPEPLRDYVNWPGSTNLAPAIVHENGQELLFFASNRPGGYGGLDLYVCERPLAADDFDFSLPRNLGALVNTAGDETTPFFDSAAQTLFFSSNGWLSMGGYDVFRSRRDAQTWGPTENMGLPWNSPADDLWYVPGPEGHQGYLSSNRRTSADQSTLYDRIFEIAPEQTRLFLSGEVIDESGTLLPGCLIGLYEQSPDGEIQLVQLQSAADGRFRFRLLPGSTYAVEASREGYRTARATLGQPNRTPGGYALTLLLRRLDTPAPPAQVPAEDKGGEKAP